MVELVHANIGRSGFTYTHKPPTAQNLNLVQYANALGFVINWSANRLSEVDTLWEKTGGPVATVLPSDHIAYRHVWTHEGRRVLVCPAMREKKVTCNNCRLCADPDRDYAIGFPAHGTEAADNLRAKANRVAKNE